MTMVADNTVGKVTILSFVLLGSSACPLLGGGDEGVAPVDQGSNSGSAYCQDWTGLTHLCRPEWNGNGCCDFGCLFDGQPDIDCINGPFPDDIPNPDPTPEPDYNPILSGEGWAAIEPGIWYVHRQVAGPNQIHAVVVDTTEAGVRLRATRHAPMQYPDGSIGQTPQTTSAFAIENGCSVAINGDFFAMQGNYMTTGLAMGFGERWPGTADGNSAGFLAGGDARVELSLPEEVVEPPAPWMTDIVSGHPQLGRDGAVTPPACAGHYCTPNPRTAIGMSQDGKAIILVVVDGRQPGYSAGMTLAEFGAAMLELGSWHSLNLDGGGSTAMYIAAQGGIVNSPSGGQERAVSNHLCVMTGQ